MPSLEQVERTHRSSVRQEGTTEAQHQLYKTAIKPTLCYVGEYWTLKRKDEQPLSKTEMCRLHWIQGVSLTEHQTN